MRHNSLRARFRKPRAAGSRGRRRGRVRVRGRGRGPGLRILTNCNYTGCERENVSVWCELGFLRFEIGEGERGRESNARAGGKRPQ